MVLPLFFAFMGLAVQAFSQELPRALAEGYLGEKDPTPYAGPWRPQFRQDAYFGRLHWDDEEFQRGFFHIYLWPEAPEYSLFLDEEVMGANSCPNDSLSGLFDDLRYGHRLLVLSHLLEGLHALEADGRRLRQPDLCPWDLPKLVAECRPKGGEMRSFLEALLAQDVMPPQVMLKDHNFSAFERVWLKEAAEGPLSPGPARLQARCRAEGRSCQSLVPTIAVEMAKRACQEDRALFKQVCSEEDELYGLSGAPVVAYLLGRSNLMALYDREGYGQGCLRRFGQLLGRKEKVPPHLLGLLPVVHGTLVRAGLPPEGRPFVHGALKEFRQKGLSKVFEPTVPPAKTEVTQAPRPAVPAPPRPVPTPAPAVAVVKKEAPPPAPKPRPPEITEDPKSAFLQASEVRRAQDLDQTEVDMAKFRYDHVFTLAELRLLEVNLRTYVTRKALEEMRTYDKLGTEAAPMPLTFIKYLIDANHHQGLYNMVNVLGDEFWVLNDVDKRWKPKLELVVMKNDDSTGRQWQLWVRRPE